MFFGIVEKTWYKTHSTSLYSIAVLFMNLFWFDQTESQTLCQKLCFIMIGYEYRIIMVGYRYITIITILHNYIRLVGRKRLKNALKPCLWILKVACTIIFDPNVPLKPHRSP